MNTATIIVMALATGAAADFRPNVFEGNRPDESADDAYTELKDLIERKYPSIDAGMMDISPGSEERQQQLEEALQKAEADQDEALLRQAQIVLDAVHTEIPEAAAAAGLSLEAIREASNQIEEWLISK
jgi:hypothetical protein